MAVKPEVGAAGGQKYPVLRSIQTFLRQMAEGGARAATAVIKELLQNADDAGATEVFVVLDERVPPAAFSQDYAEILAPALLVHNNARFKLPADVGSGEQDDFAAICDVASGHKRAQATAAGRFGIGFNSVYFLTDTPLLFSRREVHVFDLLRKIFDADGWRFPLEDFPARSASLSGTAKAVLEWCLPKSVLGTRSFGDLAFDPDGDYNDTIFRLPLRRSPEDTRALYDDRFPNAVHRLRVLSEMADEAARSILFLKYVRQIKFAVLSESGLQGFATVEATPCPRDFVDFLRCVSEQDRKEGPTEKLDCAFDREIRYRSFAERVGRTPGETAWRFHVRHVARFDDGHLIQLRARLRRNKERARPWVALAAPLNFEACRFDGTEIARWRVFLPLLEEGPCACVICGDFFIGPSRQRTEFRLNESDEGKRRTDWNQTLVQRALVDLLQDMSAELPSLAPSLLENHPKEYVSLFPVARSKGVGPANLTDFLSKCFADSFWALHLRDIWGEAFEVWVGETRAAVELELIPEWLVTYKPGFPL